MSSLPPRPKPWESAGATTTSPPAAVASATTAQPSATASAFDNAVATATSSSTVAPKLPDRPAGFGATDSSLVPGAAGYGGYQSRYSSPYGVSSMSPYGMGGMGGMGGYGSYSSPFASRYGGGYGGYGSYGGYGGGYGMGGYGVGGMGVPGEPGMMNLTNAMQQQTAPAFAVIESLVTAFTSLAQLVESTYMATHSSFFAMVGVADQLGSLKTYLGQVLGVFSVMRLAKRIINWLRGKKAVPSQGWANEWSAGLNSQHGALGPAGNTPRPSAKPLVLFLLSAVGLPYLMSRLVKLLIANQQAQAVANGQIVDQNGVIMDPTQLTFARARWEFKPQEEWELALTPDEIVAVLERRDGAPGAAGGPDAGWWRGRTRDGRTGWFPGNYVEIIKKREPTPAPTPATATAI